MRYPLPIAGLALALLAGRPGPGAAQAGDTLRLSLAEAMGRATEHHPAVVQAAAARRAGAADRLASAAVFLPRLGAELGFMRSNDPVAAFGTRLRQARFAQADFALEALNRPAPISDVSTTLRIEQPLFQPEGLMGRRAAGSASRAAARFEERTVQLARLDVIRAYFGARLAVERTLVLEEALATARRTLQQVQSLRRNGTVTLVDEQLALTRASELEASLASARAAGAAAGDGLLNLLGEPGGRPVMLTDTLVLPGAAPDPDATAERADLAALTEAAAAAAANVSRARGSWMPSAGAFGLLDFHSPDAGIAKGPSRWTAGVVLRWSPFRGLSDLGQLRRAEAERDAAGERLAAARRQADTEVRTARAEREAALLAVAAADAALAGAAQAERVAAVRYSEGVAGITELLAVRSAESAQRLARAFAIYQARVADAALAVALGRDPS